MTLRRPLLVAILAIAANGWGTSVATQSANAPTQELLAEAAELQRAYDYEGALALAEAVIAREPLNLAAHGLVRSITPQIDPGVDLAGRYRQLLAAFPNSAEAHYLMGLVAGSSEARESYNLQAVELDPLFAPAAMTVARSYRRSDPERAVHMAFDVVAGNPGDINAASRYASLLSLMGRRPEAIAFLKQSTAQYPQNLALWTSMWRMELRELGRRADPTPLLHQILAQQHRFMGSMADMERFAATLIGFGSAGRAASIELRLQIADEYPQHPRAEIALLQALELSESADQKLDAISRISERYPDSPAQPKAYESTFRSLLREERFDEAIDLARSLIDAQTAPFDYSGVGRDTSLVNRYGQSFACLGHVAWFDAAQQEIGGQFDPDPAALAPLDFRGRRPSTVLSPRAAAAAQSMLTSACMERAPFVAIGMVVARSEGHRPLAIRLLEHGTTAAMPPLPFPEIEDRMVRGMLQVHEVMPQLYLEVGRLDDALRVLESVAREDPRERTPFFYAVAAAVYEAAGRFEEALWATLQTTAVNDEASISETLERLYRANRSLDLERFDLMSAPVVPLRRVRVNWVHLDISAPATRFVGDDLTLVVLWDRRLPQGAEYVRALTTIENSLDHPGVETLAVAVDRFGRSSVRGLQQEPVADRDDQGVVMPFESLSHWGARGLPTTILLDNSGKILARQVSFDVPIDQYIEQWTAIIQESIQNR